MSSPANLSIPRALAIVLKCCLIVKGRTNVFTHKHRYDAFKKKKIKNKKCKIPLSLSPNQCSATSRSFFLKIILHLKCFSSSIRETATVFLYKNHPQIDFPTTPLKEAWLSCASKQGWGHSPSNSKMEIALNILHLYLA